MRRRWDCAPFGSLALQLVFGAQAVPILPLQVPVSMFICLPPTSRAPGVRV